MSVMQDTTVTQAPTGEDQQVLRTTLVTFALKHTTAKSALQPQLHVRSVTIPMHLACKLRPSVNSVRMGTIALLQL